MESSSTYKLVFLLTGLLLPCAAQAQMAVDSGIVSAGSPSEQFLPETGPLRTRVESESTRRFLEELLPFESSRVRISGEIREQYESWRGREFGLIPDSNNDYLLQRLYLSLETQPVDWLRTQVEIGSSFQFGSPFEPAPIDEDPLYFQQLLVDVSLIESDQGTLSAVAGRQTFSLGSGRLVATRNGPNVRRSFDAVRLVFDSDSWTSQLLYAANVNVGGSVFDNSPASDQLLWGTYATWKPGPSSVLPGRGGVDLYYLGYRNAAATFDSIAGEEHRHSFGTRLFGLFGHDNEWDYNIEPVIQFGTIQDQDILAWTVAAVLGRSFEDVPLSPRAGMKFDVISGDGSADDQRLGTFNALFPNNSYFSEAAIFAPANLYDFNLNLEAQFSEQVRLVLLWDFLWRFSTEDAIYVPPGVPSIPGGSSSNRYIGNTLSMAMEWKPTSDFGTTAAYVHFEPGDAVVNAGGQHSDFILLWATWFF